MNSKIDTIKIDARGKVLGRLATNIADILRGKNSPSFMPNKISNNKVVVYNAKDIRFTGNKIEQKKYWRHTGWPGGFREKSLKSIWPNDVNYVVRKAVWGMLPKNRLRKLCMKKLQIMAESE